MLIYLQSLFDSKKEFFEIFHFETSIGTVTLARFSELSLIVQLFFFFQPKSQRLVPLFGIFYGFLIVYAFSI